MKGQCLCGRVTIEIAQAPAYINICNCRFCRALGAAWGYFAKAEVTVTGETAGYEREDLAEVWLTGHHCPTCGSTTHYTFVPAHDQDRVGINMRLFDQDALDGIEVRYLDGRVVVEDDDTPFPRSAMGHIGDGKAF